MIERLWGHTSADFEVWLCDGSVELETPNDSSVWLDANEIHDLILALQRAERRIKGVVNA